MSTNLDLIVFLSKVMWSLKGLNGAQGSSLPWQDQGQGSEYSLGFAKNSGNAGHRIILQMSLDKVK